MSIDVDLKTSERALLVGLIHGELSEEQVEEHLSELELLADTAGVEVVGSITQKLHRINPAWFIGKGKADQVINQAHELDINLIIFDDELSPGQIKNYHKLSSKIKIIDRSALILDIFRQHARSKEAKTQVELAQLEYLLPRLTRQWTHLERQMGGVGTRAGAGETQIEVDRRLIRDRIAKLKKELIRIDKERDIQGKRRRDVFRVALVGYTNAGKSTLMNALSGADVFIQDQLFATLDTTIRSVELDDAHRFLLSDTVGFIRKLPHHLVASFSSTLKEVVEADLILVVLDASHDQVEDHYETIESVLKDLGAADKDQLIVLNKIDQTAGERLQSLKNSFNTGIMVSALEHLRLDQLLDAISSAMDSTFKTCEIEIPYTQGKDVSIAQERVEILERNYTESGIVLKIHGRSDLVDQIVATISKRTDKYYDRGNQ